MEFLIILQPTDYKSCPMAKSHFERLQKSSKSLPGVLHCVNMEELSNLVNVDGVMKPKYLIQDMSIPRVMYIKLPKEELYVKSDNWEYEYLKSQVQEIIHIFGILGAKRISYNINTNNQKHREIGGSLSIGDMPVETSVEFKSDKTETAALAGSISYPKFTITPTEELIRSDKNIYYLGKKYHWQHMVRRRLERGTLTDKFNYRFGRDVSLSLGVTTKFQKAGIGFNFGSGDISDFQIQFDIEYYPLTDDGSESGSGHDSDSDSDSDADPDCCEN